MESAFKQPADKQIETLTKASENKAAMTIKVRLNIKDTCRIIYQSPPRIQHPWSPPLCFALRTWTWTAWPHCRCSTTQQPQLSATATPSPRAGPCSVEERAQNQYGEQLQTYWPALEEPAVCADRTARIRFWVSQGVAHLWCKLIQWQ